MGTAGEKLADRVGASAAGGAASNSPTPASIVANRHGILLMLLTMCLFVAADATAKVLTHSYPVIEVTWGRFLFHVALLLPLLVTRGGAVFRTSRLRLQLTRSTLQIGSTVIYFAALALLPLATAATIAFAQPLVVTVLSVPVLGEKVGPRRWAAVVVGFLGVLIVIRPTGIVQWAALLPLATAACSACYAIATRLVARVDPVQVSLFYTAAGGLALASLAVPFVWQTPDLKGWLLMALTGVLAGSGHYCIIHAFQRAPAAMLAPFTYTQLLWATGLGYLLFGDLPDRWTVAGGLVIVGSGLYVFYRDSVRRREAAAD
jgi:drug/metabolite transporter (DMT)-like permease